MQKIQPAAARRVSFLKHCLSRVRMNCIDNLLMNSLSKHRENSHTLKGFAGEILHKPRPDQSNLLICFFFLV